MTLQAKLQVVAEFKNADFERKVAQTNKAIIAGAQKMGAAFDAAGVRIQNMLKKIQARLRELAANGLEKLQSGIKNIARGITVGLAAAGAGVLAFAGMMSKSFVETSRFAKSIGVSTQEMRLMQSAARIAGTDVEALNQSFRMFREKMGEAQSAGTGEAIEALDGLKLRITDLQNASLPEVFQIINERIQTLGLNAAQARDYVEKLGIEYDTFSAIVSNGALQEAQEVMAKFGIITADQEETFIRVSQKTAAFWEVIRNLGLEIAEGLMPLFDVLSDMLASTLPANFGSTSDAVTAFSATAVSAIGKIIARVYELIGALAQAWADLKASFDLANQFEVRKGSVADAAMTGWSNLFGDGSHDFGDGYTPPGAPDVTGPWQTKADKVRADADAAAAGILQRAPLPTAITDAVTGSTNGIFPPSTRNYPAITPPGFTNGIPSGGGGGSDSAKRTAQLAEEREARRLANEEYKKAIELYEEQREPWDQWVDSFKTGTEDMANIASDAYNEMESALVDFVKTGKLDFRSLIDSMISDIARLSIRNAVSGIFGDSGSGIFGAIGNMLGGAKPVAPAATNWNGGIVRQPTQFFANGGLASMAEKSAEAILPLQRNSKGQLGVVSEGGGSSAAPVININTTINAQTTGDAKEDGEKMARQFNKLIENKIIDVMAKTRNQRQGGRYAY